MRPIRQHRTDTTTRLLWLGLLLCVGVGWAQTDTGVEWEFLDKDGVVERRPQPPPQVIDLKAAGLPIPIEVETEVVPAGPGRVIEVEQIVSDGPGGRPFEGDFSRAGSIVEGPDEHLWLAIQGGLCRYNGQNWTIYTVEDGLPYFNGETGYVADMQFDQAGHLWYASRKGLAQFDGEKWIWHLLGFDLNTVAIGPDGDIWTGSGNEIPHDHAFFSPILYRFDGFNWWKYDSEDGLPVGSKIHWLAVDQSGTVWTSLIPNGPSLVSYDGTQFTSYFLPPGHVLADSQNRVWISGSTGLFIKDGSFWKQFPKDNAGNWVGGVPGNKQPYEDRSGKIWHSGGNTWGYFRGDQWLYYDHSLFRRCCMNS